MSSDPTDWRHVGRLLVTLVVASLVLTLLSPALVSGGVPPADSPGSATVTATATTTAADNETKRHEDPAEYEEFGDTAALEQWLSDQVTDRLFNSSAALSEGQHELARENLDEETQSYLERYTAVSDGAEGDDEPTPEEENESLSEAYSGQAELVDLVEAYRETEADYEAAQEAGDDEEAREYARDLVDLAEEIADTSSEVETTLERLEAETDHNVSAAREEITETNRTVQADRDATIDETFDETTLSLEESTEPVSFLEPMTLRGELYTVNDTPVTNEPIELDIGGDLERTETNDSGEFELTYRPRTVPAGVGTLSVTAQPIGNATYLGSEATLDAEIVQESPEIELEDSENSPAYGEIATVNGTLAVDDEPVDNVSLALELDGEAIGSVETDNGTFGTEVEIPRNVSSGDQTLVASLEDEDRALAETSTETTLTVQETETTLSMDADDSAEGTVSIDGDLRTDEGSVDNESLAIELDGDRIATVETDSDGSFNETVGGLSAAGGDATLAVVFDGEETNLEASRAETGVVLPDTAGDRSLVPTPVWLPLVLGGLLAGGVVLFARRSRGSREVTADKPTDTPAVDAAETAAATSATLLSAAHSALLGNDPDTAVRYGYAAVRYQLGAALEEGRDRRTHWEFLRRVGREPTVLEDEDDRERLYEITAGYERATFDDEPLSQSAAETHLEAARALCAQFESTADGRSSVGGQPSSDD